MKTSSSVKTINAPIETVFNTVANLENLRPLLGNTPTVTLTEDFIEATAPVVGTVSMRIVERNNNRCVKLASVKSPIKTTVWLQLLPNNDNTTRMKLTVDADIPPMLKPIVGNKLEEGIEKLADTIAIMKY